MDAEHSGCGIERPDRPELRVARRHRPPCGDAAGLVDVQQGRAAPECDGGLSGPYLRPGHEPGHGDAEFAADDGGADQDDQRPAAVHVADGGDGRRHPERHGRGAALEPAGVRQLHDREPADLVGPDTSGQRRPEHRAGRAGRHADHAGQRRRRRRREFHQHAAGRRIDPAVPGRDGAVLSAERLSAVDAAGAAPRPQRERDVAARGDGHDGRHGRDTERLVDRGDAGAFEFHGDAEPAGHRPGPGDAADIPDRVPVAAVAVELQSELLARCALAAWRAGGHQPERGGGSGARHVGGHGARDVQFVQRAAERRRGDGGHGDDLDDHDRRAVPDQEPVASAQHHVFAAGGPPGGADCAEREGAAAVHAGGPRGDGPELREHDLRG